jgi:nitroreductase
MREGWHWIVVTDPQVRAQIGDFYRRSAEPYLARAAAADPSRGVGSGVMARVSSSSAYLARHMAQVPVLVIPCITVRPAWPPGETQAGLWGSLMPAAWSYMLACRARGLGTAWTTLHLHYETEIAALLGVPGDIRQGALIPTAYYTGDTFRPRHAPAAGGRAARRSLVTAIGDLGEPYAPGTTGNPPPDSQVTVHSSYGRAQPPPKFSITPIPRG